MLLNLFFNLKKKKKSVFVFFLVDFFILLLEILFFFFFNLFFSTKINILIKLIYFYNLNNKIKIIKKWPQNQTTLQKLPKKTI